MSEFVVHTGPVWRDRSDFVVNAPLAEKDLPRKYEQLFVRQVTEDTFELCCIPFFLYDMSLGDVVRTVPRDGRKYVVDGVVRPSGHVTFRVWFGSTPYPRDAVENELRALGALLEWSSANLLAVDADGDEHAQRVADYLAAGEDAGRFVYETGRR